MVCFFSSVAGRFGNVGQADYACANEILNAIAGFGQQKLTDCRFISMCWGPFDGGMVTADLARMFKNQGIGLIPLEGGAKHVVAELLFSGPETTETVIGVGDPELGGRRGAKIPEKWEIPHSLIPEKCQWLMDHRLKSAPVLPMAFAIEWVAEAAKQVFPELYLYQINNFEVLRGISFDSAAKEPAKPVNFRFHLKKAAEQPTQGLLLDVEIRQDEKNPTPVPNYKAQVLLLTETPDKSQQKPEMPPMQNLDKTVAEAYKNYLFHGPSLQCIKSIAGISAQAIAGKLACSKPELMEKGHNSNWQTEPVLMDGLAQLGLIWLGTHKQCIGIPQRLKTYTQLRPFDNSVADSQVLCIAGLESLNEKSRKASMNFAFYDEQGLVAEGQGWEAVFDETFNQYTTLWKEKHAS
jgi:hypothetical protein